MIQKSFKMMKVIWKEFLRFSYVFLDSNGNIFITVGLEVVPELLDAYIVVEEGGEGYVTEKRQKKKKRTNEGIEKVKDEQGK